MFITILLIILNQFKTRFRFISMYSMIVCKRIYGRLHEGIITIKQYEISYLMTSLYYIFYFDIIN